VERDKVNLLLAELVSSVGAAMAPYVNEQKIRGSARSRSPA
jgi:hypothetical protein